MSQTRDCAKCEGTGIGTGDSDCGNCSGRGFVPTQESIDDREYAAECRADSDREDRLIEKLEKGE